MVHKYTIKKEECALLFKKYQQYFVILKKMFIFVSVTHIAKIYKR